MSREQRREMRVDAVAGLKKAKAFVVVVWDGKNLPIFRYDVTVCKEENDLRHYVMQKIAENVEGILNAASVEKKKLGEEILVTERVLKAKEKRSAELRG